MQKHLSKYEEPPMDEVLAAYGIKGVHPAADLFPLTTGQEWLELCDSIGRDGLEQDIVLTHDGLLLDGRNRLRACYVTGQLERFDTLSELYASDYVGYVLRMNVHRRHLTPGQRAAIAAEALGMYEAEAKERQIDATKRGNVSRHGVPRHEGSPQVVENIEAPVVAILPPAIDAEPAPKAREKAAAEIGASPRYVQDAKAIKQEAPEVFEQVKAGAMTIPQAKREIKQAKAKARPFITLSQWKAEKMQAVPEPHESASFNRQSDTDEASMGNIEWAAWSWNPVTGCKHGCSYCYARDIANRFYPQKFEPSLHPDRLAAPYITKVPKDADTNPAKRNVFANSMSDLYGRWVPQAWIDAVFKAMSDNPQWRFLTLTKFPKRAAELTYPENVWIGTSVDLQARVAAAEEAFQRIECGVRWLSLEPLLEPLAFKMPELFDWVVIGGASRSTQTPEWTPPAEWIIRTASQFLDANPDVRIYLKTNARPREYPGTVTAQTADDAFRYLKADKP